MELFLIISPLPETVHPLESYCLPHSGCQRTNLKSGGYIWSRPISSQQTNKSSMKLEREVLVKNPFNKWYRAFILTYVLLWDQIFLFWGENIYGAAFSRLAWLCRHYPLRNIALGNMLHLKLYIFPHSQTENGKDMHHSQCKHFFYLFTKLKCLSSTFNSQRYF